MDTLKLDTSIWDLDVDTLGNWATVGDATPQTEETGPAMRMAQDVATQCAAWKGEVYYDTTLGIDYPNVLGQAPNLAMLQSAYNTQALLVAEVETALTSLQFTAGKSRKVTGTITTSDVNGNIAQVTL